MRRTFLKVACKKKRPGFKGQGLRLSPESELRGACFRGFQPQSFSDYEGCIAAVLFTGGCNFRCRFCYNAPLVIGPEKLPPLSAERALALLKERVGFLEAVVISGGEPTLESWIIPFLRKLRELGLLVGLDTNGSRPEVLREIVKQKLVDRIAMDLKGPLEKYSLITCTEGYEEAVLESLKLAGTFKQHEIRLTLHPLLHTEEDVRAMAELLHEAGACKIALQSFKPWGVLDPSLEEVKGYSLEELNRFCKLFPGRVIVR